MLTTPGINSKVTISAMPDGIEMLIKRGLSFRLSGRQERTEESGDSSLKWMLI